MNNTIVIGGANTEDVIKGTWGHMQSKPGKYKGRAAFACGAYGDTIVVASEFGDAGYGPWFYQAIHDFMHEQDMDEGTIYRFDGYYHVRSEDDCGTFKGKLTKI